MMRRIVPILTALALLPATAPAQESGAMDADTAAPKAWSAEAGVTLNSAGGNESLTVFTITGSLGHLRTDIFEFGLNTRFRYGESEGEVVAQNLRGETNFDLWPEAKWSPFLFGTAEQDPIKQLEARFNGGAGAKRTFWQDGWSEVSLSGAVLYSYENLAIPDSLAATLGDGVSQTARWSWRIRGRKEIGAGKRLEQTVFYQPAFTEFEDYQLESITDIRIAVSQTMAFSTTILYQRDSTPAPGVLPDDYSISLGLTVATEW